MSVDNTDVVDAIGIEASSKKVVLTISDQLDWSDESQHLITLQEKINAYLRFIESGEILTVYPNAAGRGRVINVVLKESPPPGALRFFDEAQAILSETDIELRISVFHQDG